MSKISFFLLIIISIIHSNSRIIVLPIYYSSPNEPNQFEVNSILDYYSKNEIYTSIKMGSPPSDLEILLEDNDSGFYIKDGNCISGSDYRITKSDTFASGEGFVYQYFNNELTVFLNGTNDKITLNQASKEYFYSSLNNRRFGRNLTSIEVNNFTFLYIPNSEEIRKVEEKINEKRKQQKEKQKKDQKNINDNEKEKDNNEKNKKDKKDKKDKKNDGYGENYCPNYYDFYGD
jgi:hypothetical protein